MDSLHRQLLSNQVWESVSFVAKAAFLFLLTPLMRTQWGVDGYGEFAVASSSFVLFSACDLGIRPWMRVELAKAARANCPEQFSAVYRCGLIAFASASFVVVGICTLLAMAGLWSATLGIASDHEYLIPITAGLTFLAGFSGLLSEPLSVHGRMGTIKFSVALGALLALAAVWGSLHWGASITTAVIAWIGSACAANIALFVSSGLWSELRARSTLEFRWCDVVSTLKQGSGFSVSQISWALKTHGLTLLVSLLLGPSTAGVFFVLLRLSELVGLLGSVSSDACIAPMAQAADSRRQAECFSSGYRYTTILCVHGAIMVALLTQDFLALWLQNPPALPVGTGLWVAAYGCAIALNRVAAGAAMGVGRERLAARYGIVETALTLVSTWVLISWNPTTTSPLQAAALSAVALLPLATAVSRVMEQSAFTLWVLPLRQVIPYAVVTFGLLMIGHALQNLTLLLVSVVCAGGVVFLNLFARKPVIKMPEAALEEVAD